MLNIPEETVVPLAAAKLQIDDGPLDYEVRNRQQIDANWLSDVTDNPALFNGPFFMAEAADVDNGVFAARYRRTRFATMLHWKKNADLAKPWHVFAVGVIVSADNQLIAGRMAASTSAAGRVYFPAGSFDEGDVVGGTIDIEGNMHREVAEETGIDLSAAADRDSATYLVTSRRSIALFRRYYLALEARELLARISAHIASEQVPELDGVTAISAAGEMGEATPAPFRIFGDWHFSEEQRRRRPRRPHRPMPP